MNEGDVELSTIAGTLFLFVLLSSCLAFSSWIRRWLRHGFVLAYQPRRRLPWGPIAGVLALLMTAMGIGNAMMMRGNETPEVAAGDFASAYWTMTLMQVGFTAAIVAVLVLLLGAGRRDLGLPTNFAELGADVSLGVWMGLALMVPVFALQMASIFVLGIAPGHPLLDQMTATPDLTVFAVAMAAAVIVAPVFEEIVYRLLLQGGLERLEDEHVGWPFSRPTRASERLVEEHAAESEVLANQDEFSESAGSAPKQAAGEELFDTTIEPEELPAIAPGGPGMLPGLSHGWAPILISSFLFALAHLGNGPSPIPLFAMAMFLGYAYQRTHRILPSIIAHVVLNLTSVTVLIVQLMSAR
jgi:membrane protease YdiL (CAAX protease family)